MSLLFWLMLAGYGLGVAGALLAPTAGAVRRSSALGAIVGSAGGTALALSVLLTGMPWSWRGPALLSVADGFAIELDPLGSVFLLLVGLVAIPSALYGAAYSRHYEGRHSLRWLGAMLNLFLLTMSLVAGAGNVLTFALMWEGMSLTSYFLVLTTSDERETVAAGTWYVAMTHAGLACIIAALLIVATGAASTSFGDLRTAAAAMSPAARNAVFLLALVGFGSKAGLVPVHVWLPRAHPAAPSHVSALMSGVMIKMGVYGILRVGLDLLGGGPAWWGMLLIGAGALSAVVGVLYALMEDDLKRLLAYSSIENVGLIVIGIGAGFLFVSLRSIPAAVLALSAALYHSLNHAAFKGLLFLGAGSVLHAAHTRDMNRLGGLIARLPWTAAFFLVGSLSIAALPPFNGFVSEWLLFQSLLPGVTSSAKLVAPFSTLAIGIVALTAGLAAAAFVKAFGITFLAMPRSDDARHAREVPLTMRTSMGALAVACVALSLAAVPVRAALTGALSAQPVLAAAPMPPAGPVVVVASPAGVAGMSPLLVAIGLAILVAGVWVGARVFGARRRVRVSATWGCGRVVQTPRMEYTSTAFAEPLRRVFAELIRPTQDLSIAFHPQSEYFVRSITYRSAIVPWFERYLYAPIIAGLTRWAIRVRALQSGSAHAYLTYMVIALIGLLSLILLRQS
ncbi:MAG TPA: proton-conducting transporter membrane subunit [Vicinamibacterales bacterium]|nr:proton-conducting transporter membrane subunit [Vicinamibacterales bacterium]